MDYLNVAQKWKVRGSGYDVLQWSIEFEGKTIAKTDSYDDACLISEIPAMLASLKNLLECDELLNGAVSSDARMKINRAYATLDRATPRR